MRSVNVPGPLQMILSIAAIIVLLLGLPALLLFAQRENPQQPVQPESIKSNAPPPQAASGVRFVGNAKFSDKELSLPVANPLAAIQHKGLTQPLADDTPDYIRVFYRSHAFPSVAVKK